jgi:Skp family chaperone for outer membrane proteins
MKKFIFALTMIGAIGGAGLAQTPTPRPSTTSSAPAAAANTAAPAGGTGAEGKVAYINTAAFRNGIIELKGKLDTFNGEIEPKKKEIQALEEELTNLKNKINTQGSTVSVQVRNQWAEDYTDKEKAYKRKAEDFNALGERRLGEIQQPIYDKVAKYLESYCQARGIVLVMEGGVAQQTGILLFAAPTTDITDDFMKEYNKANGGGAAAAPKK